MMTLWCTDREMERSLPRLSQPMSYRLLLLALSTTGQDGEGAGKNVYISLEVMCDADKFKCIWQIWNAMDGQHGYYKPLNLTECIHLFVCLTAS